MERAVERMGITAVVAIAALFVALYSLWGASVLRAEQANAGQSANHTIGTNL